jgi:tetratricopeptide (TPR) repeat protein
MPFDMRTLSLLFITIATLILTVASDSRATSILSDSTRAMSHRDSVRERYLNNGAWRYSIYSNEYGCAIDSGILFSHDDAYLWQQRSMPYFKQMKYEIGMRYLDSAVKYDPGAWLDYRAFIKCVFQKSYRAALSDFEAAKRLHPTATVMDHEYAFYMGLCYLQLEEYDSAEACFTQCIANDRALSSGWVHYMHTFYLGVTQYVEGHFAHAIESFDLAIATYPRFSDAKYYKALCLLKTGQDQLARGILLEARDDAREGLTINEDNAIYERYPYQIRPQWPDLYIANAQTTIDTHRSQ